MVSLIDSLRFAAGVFFIALVVRILLVIFQYFKLRLTFTCFKTYSCEIPFIYLWATGKIPKNISFTTFFFSLIVSICKRFEKDGIFLFWGFWPVIIVFHERYVKAFVNDHEGLNKPIMYDIFQEMSGKGLLTSNGSTWKAHRKMLNPAFRFDILKSYIPIFNGGAKRIVKNLAEVCNKPTVEVVDILKTGSLKILCESILEMDLKDGRYDSKLQRYLELLTCLGQYTMYRVPRPWLFFKHPQLLFQVGRDHRRLYKEFHDITKEIILDIKERYNIQDSECSKEDSEEFSYSGKSFTRILLENHMKDPSFTFEDVMGEINNFIFAGHDTTSYTMLWCLFLLGHNPDVQERAYEELESVVSPGTAINYGDLNKLEYLECVIKESLRLYPVVPFYGRQISKEIKLGENKIPSNSIIIVSPYMMHRNPYHFPDPEKFCPERFYRNSLTYPWGFTPFSEGVRSCIGKKFAMMEMKVVLAHVLRNFKVKTLCEKDIDVEWTLILTPSKPIPFLLERRQRHPEG